MRCIAHVLAALALLIGRVSADDKVELVHKPDFATGRVIRQVSEMTMEQTLVLAGMNIDSKIESFSATRDTVGETTPDGKTKMHGEFEYFIANIETPVGNLSFDSGKSAGGGDTAPLLQPVYDLFQATSKAKWVAIVNSKPEIESIAFEGNPFDGLEDSVKGEVTPERFMHEYNIQLRRLPGTPVAVGDTWKRTEEVNAGNGQTLTLEKVFKYTGPKTENGNTVDRIEIQTLAVDYTIGSGSQLPFKLDSSDLNIAASEGQMTFDRRYRIVTQQAEKVRIGGKLAFTINVNGQEQKLPSELDLTIDAKLITEPQAP